MSEGVIVEDKQSEASLLCDLCKQPISDAPFTIVTPIDRIENVCGECMNLYGNQLYDELVERIESFAPPLETLEEPVSNLQAFIWGALMESRYTKRDLFEILDETIDGLNDDYILYDSSITTVTEEEV